MCLGGGSMGRSAEEFYQEIKKTPDPLPSLPTDTSKRIERAQGRGLRRVGKPQRTLLNVDGSNYGG